MFIEPLLSADSTRGWIEIISGPMFSGKTEELIRRLKRAQIAAKKVAIFKPLLDERYSKDNIVSHNSNSIEAIRIKQPIKLVEHIDEAEVIGIDEAQFFDDSLLETVKFLALKGKRVIVAGLDMDSNGKPFGSIPDLFAIAEYVTKLHAICMRCGSLAIHSFRKAEDNDSLIFVGGTNEYEALCRFCFNKAFKGSDETAGSMPDNFDK